jgi:hypothetical protein
VHVAVGTQSPFKQH